MHYFSGVENLSSVSHLLKGKKIGLLTNHSGVDSNLYSTIDILKSKFNLTKLFAPEHGIRGELQANARVSSYVDTKTGLEVISCFGENYGNAIKEIDCLVYDIQDVGVRHFSYPYLMANMMKITAREKIPFVILDRYNPLGLSKVSGNIFDDKFSCGFGGYSLATQYGMTIGELARYINAEYNIGCELHIAPCIGLERNANYYDYRPHWVLPGPNCPTFETVLCYVGTVLFEGTNVSEGRGTTRPFEIIGAPWLNNDALVEEMRSSDLAGVAFRTAYFQPTFSKYKGELCRGVQIHITDVNCFESYRCALILLHTIREMHKEFEFPGTEGKPHFIDRLAGTSDLRSDLFNPYTYLEAQKPLLKQFKEKTQQYYIY